MLDRFTVTVDVVIRPCRREDLPALEWWALFRTERRLMEVLFDRHRRGQAVMLVAEVNGEPAGQAWINLGLHHRDATGVIWAVRILPCLRGCGIGSRLVLAAESELLARGFTHAELTVEQRDGAARRLYERLGYTMVGMQTERVRLAPRDPGAERPQWLLRKTLLPEPARWR